MAGDMSTHEESLLKGWFSRAMTRCGQDPHTYDFDAEIDRSLTYYENKSKLQSVVDCVCGAPKVSPRLQRYEQAAKERAQFICQYCGVGFKTCNKYGISASQQLESHEKIERAMGRPVRYPRAPVVIAKEEPLSYEELRNFEEA